MKWEKIDCKKAFLLPLLFLSCVSASDGGAYICTGPQSRRYHKTATCKGLSRCSGEIKKITVEQAKSMGRTPCKRCYKHNKIDYEQ